MQIHKEINETLNSYPLVTIVTSVYNGGDTLEKAMESVFKQTYYNIEYIIIDGGSQDNTLSIIKKYSSNLAYWISEPDKGIYDAWNKALKVAKGEWIAFLGADDILKIDAVQRMVEVAELSFERLDYISGRTEIEKDGKVLKTSGGPWEWVKFKKYVCTGHNAALHNRNIFEQYGYYDISYKSSGDYDMLLRVGKKLKTGYVNVVTSTMSMGGVSNRSDVAIWETYNVIVKNGHTPKIIAFLDFIKTLVSWHTKRWLKLND